MQWTRGEEVDMGKIYSGNQLAERVFYIVMAGIAAEIAVMVLIVL